VAAVVSLAVLAELAAQAVAVLEGKMGMELTEQQTQAAAAVAVDTLVEQMG
jgi:hypothetical protein